MSSIVYVALTACMLDGSRSNDVLVPKPTTINSCHEWVCAGVLQSCYEQERLVRFPRKVRVKSYSATVTSFGLTSMVDGKYESRHEDLPLYSDGNTVIFGRYDHPDKALS